MNFKSFFRLLVLPIILLTGTAYAQLSQVAVSANDHGSGRVVMSGQLIISNDGATTAYYADANRVNFLENMMFYASNRSIAGKVAVLAASITDPTATAFKTAMEARGWQVSLYNDDASINTVASMQAFDLIFISCDGNGGAAQMDNASFNTNVQSYVNGGGGLLVAGWFCWKIGQSSNFGAMLNAISPYTGLTSGYGWFNKYNLTKEQPSHPIYNNVSLVSWPDYGEYPTSGSLRSGATIIAKYAPYVLISASSNSPRCTGSTLNFTAAGGVSYAWTGPNGFSSSSQNPTRANVSVADAGTYTCVITRSDASTISMTVNVVVSAPPSTANAGVDFGVNSAASSFSFAATPPTNGTGAWTYVSGPNTPTITTPSSATSTVTGFTTGSYVFRWTVSSGACTASTDLVNVSVASLPTITALSPNPVTAGQTLTITGSNFTGATGVTINGATVPFTVISSTNLTVVVPAGTLTGNVVVSTASGSSTAIPLTVINLPTISSIANQTIGIGGTTSALNFTVSDAETAATSLVVSATSTNTSLVPVSNIALSGTGANRVLSVTAAANQTGIAKITLTVTDQDGNTANTTFAVIVNGASEPLVLVGGSCVGVGALSASVKPDFAANTAGWSGAGLGTSGFYGTLRLAQTFLQKSTLPVNRVSVLLNRAGNTSDFPIKVYIKNTDANGKPGDVTLGEASIANLSPTNFGQNTYTFQFNSAVQLTAGIKYALIFEALSGSITASPSGGDAYPDGTQFESSDMINWTASSFTGNDVIFSMNYVPTTNEFKWYKDGALVPSITTASYTPSDAGSYMVILNPVGLPASTASNAIILNPVPTVNQPPNQTIINGTAIQPINFVGTVPNTTFNWIITNSGFGIPSSGVGDIPAYVVNANLAGSPSGGTTIIVTPTANGCVGAPRNILLTILSPWISVNGTINPFSTCEGSPSASQSFNVSGSNLISPLSISAPNGFEISTNSTAGFASTLTLNPSGAGTITALPIYVRLAASATGTPSGTIQFATTNSNDGLVWIVVSGTVNAKPSAPIVSNITTCPNTNLSALSATGSNLLWYTNATGGVGSATAPTPSASTPGTTSYWVTQTTSGCESDRARLDVIVHPVPTVNQPTNVLVQNGTATPPVIFTGAVSSTSYAWTSSNTSFGLSASGTGNIASFTANYTGGGNVQQVVSTIVVTPSANGCVGTAKTFTFTLNLNAAPTNISLSKANLFEANALGATVGNLSSTDPDVGDTHMYALVGGSGGGDNASFTIVGNQLKANAVFNFATKRLYAVRIRTTDAGGLPFEKEFLISISKTPIVLGTGNLPSTKKQTPPSANPSISKGYSSFLTVTGENLTGYLWSPGIGLSANNIANPVASPAQTTTYNVTVTNSFGSTTVVPITITVLQDYNVTPNNLLTPNGDGINDTWAIENIASYPNNEVKVVDKAGRLVFTQKGYANTWDGANLTPDTYYYIIIFGPDVAPKKGFITIIR